MITLYAVTVLPIYVVVGAVYRVAEFVAQAAGAALGMRPRTQRSPQPARRPAPSGARRPAGKPARRPAQRGRSAQRSQVGFLEFVGGLVSGLLVWAVATFVALMSAAVFGASEGKRAAQGTRRPPARKPATRPAQPPRKRPAQAPKPAPPKTPAQPAPEAPPAAPSAPSGANVVPIRKDPPPMPTTTAEPGTRPASGDVANYETALAALDRMRETGVQAKTEAETLHAALSGAIKNDADTLGEVMQIMDAADQIVAATEKARATFVANHQNVAEAVNASTGTAQSTEFYR